jgi:hypothetical protein
MLTSPPGLGGPPGAGRVVGCCWVFCATDGRVAARQQIRAIRHTIIIWSLISLFALSGVGARLLRCACEGNPEAVDKSGPLGYFAMQSEFQ